MATAVLWDLDYWLLNSGSLLDFEQSPFSADLVWGVHVCMSAFSNMRGHLRVLHISLDRWRKKRDCL